MMSGTYVWIEPYRCSVSRLLKFLPKALYLLSSFPRWKPRQELQPPKLCRNIVHSTSLYSIQYLVHGTWYFIIYSQYSHSVPSTWHMVLHHYFLIIASMYNTIYSFCRPIRLLSSMFWINFRFLWSRTLDVRYCPCVCYLGSSHCNSYFR